MSKKPKICFFSPSSYPYFYKDTGVTSGGAELQMSLIAKELAKTDKYEVCFFIADYGQQKIDYIDGVKLIRTFSLPRYEGILSKLIKAVKYFFFLAKYRPDVVISTTANSIVGLTAFYKYLLRYKFIYRTAGKIDVELKWIKDNGLLGKIFQYGLKKADAVIVQNNEQQPILQKYIGKNSTVIKNIVSSNCDTSNQNKSFVLWVGRFAAVKQADVFVKLATSLPKHKFVMICNHDLSDNWKKLEIKISQTNNLEFKDRVDFSEINKYFNKASILVNTSSSEGFPNTFLQAAAAKTPIISLNVNPDNFLNDYNCGISCNNDFDMMVKSVNELINNDEKAKLMGTNAYNYLLKNHNAKVIIPKLTELIDLVVKK